MPSLEQQAVHGVFWSFLERFGQLGIQFVIGIVLARLLEPSDFGLVGMIIFFFALASTIVDSGFGQALIQKQSTDRKDESTVLWLNLLLGLLMSGSLFLAGPGLASFYERPLLEPLAQVYSLNLFVHSFAIVPNALLIKELAFKRRMGVVIVSILISGLLGITLALRGFGVWSLIFQSLSMSICRTVGLWVVHPWRPLFIFSVSSLKSLWSFGSNMLVAGFINTFFDNIYLLIIGKAFSASVLGHYQRGKQLVEISSQSLSRVVSQVNFPLLARIQHDRNHMRAFATANLRCTMMLVAPMMLGLAIVAPIVVQLLFGNKWMPCVPLFRILCGVGILYPIHYLNMDVLKALGRSDLILRLEFVKKGLVLLNIILCCRYGVMALLAGHVICSFIALLPNSYFNGRYIGFGFIAQMSSLKNIIAATGIAGISVFFISLSMGDGVLALCLLGIIFSIIYTGLMWLLKEPAMSDVAKFCRMNFWE